MAQQFVGEVVLNCKTIKQPESKNITSEGNTVEEAISAAKANFPAGSVLTNTIQYPPTPLYVPVEAPDWASASAWAKANIPGVEVEVVLVEKGSQVFLGKGKKLDLYHIKYWSSYKVEVTYSSPGEYQVLIGPVWGKDLLDAVGEGNLEEVRLLLAEDIDISGLSTVVDIFGIYTGPVSDDYWQEPENRTRTDPWEIAKILLETGASTKTKGAQSILAAAVRHGDLEMLKLLIERDVSIDTLTKQSHKDRRPEIAYVGLDMLAQLLQKVNINHSYTYGNNLLLYAAEDGDVVKAEFLIEHGANIENVQFMGWTPLAVAAYGCHYDMVKLLIEKGADVNATGYFREEKGDRHGNIALMGAKEGGNKEIIELLLQHGAQ